MTSMPLTLRRMLAVLMQLSSKVHGMRTAKGRPWSFSSGLAVFRRAARQFFLRRVLVRSGLRHRLDDLLVGLHPGGAEHPLAAVPGVDARPVRTEVIDAARAHRTHHAGESECVELLLVQREVLKSPSNLVARHDLALAVALLRTAHAF